VKLAPRHSALQPGRATVLAVRGVEGVVRRQLEEGPARHAEERAAQDQRSGVGRELGRAQGKARAGDEDLADVRAARRVGNAVHGLAVREVQRRAQRALRRRRGVGHEGEAPVRGPGEPRPRELAREVTDHRDVGRADEPARGRRDHPRDDGRGGREREAPVLGLAEHHERPVREEHHVEDRGGDPHAPAGAGQGPVREAHTRGQLAGQGRNG